MKEQIRKEVMKVYDQEASVDEVVEKLLVLFNVVGRSEQLLAFYKWYQLRGKMWRGETGEEVVKDFLSQ